MADHSKQRLNVDQLCGMHHLANVCKSCKSFLLTRRHKKNNSSPNKIEAPKDLNPIDQKKLKDQNNKNQHKETINTDLPNHIENNDNHSKTAPSSPHGHSISIPSHFSSHSQPLRTSSNHVSRTPSRLSKSASQKSQSGASMTTTPTTSSLLKSMSRKSNNVEAGPPGSAFSRSSSIMYSNSNGVIKPPAVQQTLECTLEEICFGCIKKIKIKRDVVTNYGQIVQEDEVLTIKVKPGWKTGTTITFDGMGNETPGGQTSDLTFVIAEKQHALFKRDGDDLVLTINVPLVTALVDSTPSIPLLGGDTMKLEMGNSTICPGDQHIVAGQGMPKSKEQGERGKLIVNFLVAFPKELSDEQKAGVFDILKDCC